jgi:hypothetical protein
MSRIPTHTVDDAPEASRPLPKSAIGNADAADR